MASRRRHMAELCSPLPLGFLPKRGSSSAAGRQPASVVGRSPTTLAWRTNIRRPDVIGADDRQAAQEIRVDLVGRMPLTRPRPAIHRGDAHTPHQGRDLPSPNGMALLPEEIPQHPGAGKRIVQMQCVNPAHQRQYRVRNWFWLIVRCGPSQLQQLALSRNC
jgi:hypothetical protein